MCFFNSREPGLETQGEGRYEKIKKVADEKMPWEWKAQCIAPDYKVMSIILEIVIR